MNKTILNTAILVAMGGVSMSAQAQLSGTATDASLEVAAQIGAARLRCYDTRAIRQAAGTIRPTNTAKEGTTLIDAACLVDDHT